MKLLLLSPPPLSLSLLPFPPFLSPMCAGEKEIKPLSGRTGQIAEYLLISLMEKIVSLLNVELEAGNCQVFPVPDHPQIFYTNDWVCS